MMGSFGPSNLLHCLSCLHELFQPISSLSIVRTSQIQLRLIDAEEEAQSQVKRPDRRSQEYGVACLDIQKDGRISPMLRGLGGDFSREKYSRKKNLERQSSNASRIHVYQKHFRFPLMHSSPPVSHCIWPGVIAPRASSVGIVSASKELVAIG